MSQDHQWNYHLYMTSPKDFEYTATVPVVADEPEFTLHLAAVGGGTPGKAYAGNWYYSVTVPGHRTFGHELMHGDDLYTGTPTTHEQAARTLAGWLASTYPEGTAEHDALSLFAEGA